jgi:predicted dehydrogenase
MAHENQGSKPRSEKDIRKVLESSDVDLLVIAAPDHWHAPATIMALQAGKHVYVEKPCGHNAREGEWLVAAQEKYGKVVQMGNQQRSGVFADTAIEDIKNGLIGEPYHAKCWYANKRTSIGHGKAAAVPDELDYQLWQGPAPRENYRDNIIHYNWHWFKNWGTGEICNNGTHALDIARWLLEVDYPTKVTSAGGRYHVDDDWEFPDTQNTAFEFGDRKSISWESVSRNGMPSYGQMTGTLIQGTKGNMIVNTNGYRLFDESGKTVKELLSDSELDTGDLVGINKLTHHHAANTLDAIRKGTALTSPIAEGHKSVLLCHLGNISQQVGRTLHIDPVNGHIQDDPEATALWGREYAEGWEPSV